MNFFEQKKQGDGTISVLCLRLEPEQSLRNWQCPDQRKFDYGEDLYFFVHWSVSHTFGNDGLNVKKFFKGNRKRGREEEGEKEKGSRSWWKYSSLTSYSAKGEQELKCLYLKIQSLYCMACLFFISRVKFSWTLFFFSYQKVCAGESVLTSLNCFYCRWDGKACGKEEGWAIVNWKIDNLGFFT